MKIYDHAGAPNPKKLRVYRRGRVSRSPVKTVEIATGKNRGPEYLRIDNQPFVAQSFDCRADCTLLAARDFGVFAGVEPNLRTGSAGATEFRKRPSGKA
jgi:hypothetical protein